MNMYIGNAGDESEDEFPLLSVFIRLEVDYRYNRVLQGNTSE